MFNSGGIYILITGCLWGTTGVFQHLYEDFNIEPTMMAILRVAAAIIVMTPFMFKKGIRTFVMSKRGFAIAFIQGILTQTVFNIAYFSAIGKLGMASAVVLLYTSPITVAILSRLMFGESITSRKVFAISLTLVGCALTATGGNFDVATISIYGIMMGLLAGFCYGTFSITSRIAGETDNPLALTYYTMVSGLVGLIIVALITGAPVPHMNMELTVTSLINGSCSAALPYFLFSIGITRLREVSKAPILSSSENVSAALIGYFAFHEALGVYRVVGIALVIISIVLINTTDKNKLRDISEDMEELA